MISSGKMSRRNLLAGAAAASVVLVQTASGKAFQAALTASELADDPTKVPGIPPGVLGTRSPFEKPVKTPSDTSSRTPLQDLHGIITPSDLHYERHHGGVPAIDPSKHQLVIMEWSTTNGIHVGGFETLSFGFPDCLPRMLGQLPRRERRHDLPAGDLWPDEPFAERKRFELSIQLPIYYLSRVAPSTTRTPLCFVVWGAKIVKGFLFPNPITEIKCSFLPGVVCRACLRRSRPGVRRRKRTSFW
jgi:hypothetical protein